MDSKTLIGDVREKYSDLNQGNLEQELCDWIKYKTDNKLAFTEKDFAYFLQRTKALHYRSFYLGWIEGRMDLKYGQESTD